MTIYAVGYCYINFHIVLVYKSTDIKKERFALFLSFFVNKAGSIRTYLALIPPKRFLNLSTRPPVSTLRCLPV